MAMGIYKRTMQGARSSRSNGEGARDQADDAPYEGVPRTQGSGGTDREGTAPVIGKRTMYVDRQVKRRAHTRSKTKKIRRLQILVAVLILALIGLSMAWILNYALIQQQESQLLALDVDLRRAQTELQNVRSRLEAREAEFSDLVQGRIPGLEPLTYNELLEVNDKYLLNITFSESGVDEHKALEFHARLMNASNKMILPKVKIVLYDEVGLQAGIVELRKSFAAGTAVLAELQPGETRSYHSTIEIERDATPKYFMLHVE